MKAEQEVHGKRQDRISQSNDPPSFPFYWRDWLASLSVRAMTPEQRGGYIDYLAFTYGTKTPGVQSEDDAETNIVPGWCPYGTLVGVYAASTAATDATGFSVQNLIDADSLVSCSALELGYGLNLALIDSEIIAWQTVSGSGSTRTIANVMRGVLDTVPAAHSAGAKVWFFTSGAGGIVNPTGGYTADGTVTAKLLPYNLRYTLAISLATQLSVTLASRAFKPLPPGNVKVAGSAWPTSLAHGVDIALTWAHRHRVNLAAAGVVVAQDAGDYSASPEGNYTVEVRVGGTLKRTVTAIAGTTWTWTAAMQATDGGAAAAAVTIRVIPVNGSLAGTYQERGFMLT